MRPQWVAQTLSSWDPPLLSCQENYSTVDSQEQVKLEIKYVIAVSQKQKKLCLTKKKKKIL